MVIRPLAYCSEADIAEYAEQRQFPIIPCKLCGSQDNLQRKQIRRMMDEWEKTSPGRTEQVFKSLQKIQPSQLADANLFDFASLGSRQPSVEMLNWLLDS